MSTDQTDVRSFGEILENASTIAIVGCSPREHRTSHKIARYLLSAGYTIVPVNPNAEEILGQTCYPSLLDVPSDTQIDIVDIFRRPEFVEGVVKDVLEWRRKTGQEPVVWTQIGVSSDAAQRKAEENSLPYVADRCIMVEHSHLAA